MSTSDVITVPAVDEVDTDTNLVFQRVDVVPSVTPYSRQVSLTIGAKVYTFETADLFEAMRLLQGS